MKSLFPAITLLLLLSNCKQSVDNKIIEVKTLNSETKRIYSEAVGDSFSIFINLPKDMSFNKKYPVIYLLDANFYFDILASIKTKYTELGLLPPFILVGIGYKDFPQMDSLRDRDYTYPVAFKEDSFSVSGGGEKFLRFIKKELVPKIDKKYPVNKDRQALMGHSLGGYFTLYALKNNGDNCFNQFIAASPSLDYGKYYLFDQFDKYQNDLSKAKVYITYGGSEDIENKDISKEKMLFSSEQTLKKITEIFKKEKLKQPVIKTEIFSNLEHMDTPLPSFIKGMQWILNTDE